MPINFNIADVLNRTQRLFDNPTGFDDRVIQMLNNAFGANNVFGTVAVRDTGTTGGEAPLVQPDGTLSALFEDASTTHSGVSALGPLGSPASARQTVGDAIDTIGGSALGVRNAPREEVRGSRTNTRFISRLSFTEQHSLILISAAGGNAAVLGDIFGTVRMQSVILFPNATAADDAVRIHVNSGRPPRIVDGVIDTNALNTEYRTPDGTAVEQSRDCFQVLSQAQLQAFGLSWGFRLRRYGAAQGELYDVRATRREFTDRYSAREFTERRDADLLIAYKPGVSNMFFETNITDRQQFLPSSSPFTAFSSGQAAGADGFAIEILL